MLRTCLILCLVAASQQLSITDFAVPSAVKLGENAELQCRHSVGVEEKETEVYVKWWWTSLESDKRYQIYQRLSGRQPVSMSTHINITIKENDAIELLDLQATDSGIYECEVSDVVHEQRQHQKLVVYTGGSGPQINITRVEDGPDEDEEEDVVVTCEATGVAPEPDLLISINGVGAADIIENITQTADGVYSIYANATLPKEVEAGTLIRCELYFVDSNITHEAYDTSLIYDDEGSGAGAEASTTLAPEDTTFWDPNQNNTSGSTRLTKTWALLVAIAMPVQLLALH